MLIEKVIVHFPDGVDMQFNHVDDHYNRNIFTLNHIWNWRYRNIYNFRTVEVLEDKTEIWVEFV